MTIPYIIRRKRSSHAQSNGPILPRIEKKVDTIVTSHIETAQPESSPAQAPTHRDSYNPGPECTTIIRHHTSSYSNEYITVRIVMPTNYGFRSWRWYEAVIESLAVGIYLYATFVLTSTIFLNADKAITYTTIMTLCLSAVRILTASF